VNLLLKKSYLLFALVLAFVSVLSVTTSQAYANTNNNGKPGWGYGDKNHHHVGPPGQSVRPDGDKDFDDRISSDINKFKNDDKLSNQDKGIFIDALEGVYNEFKGFFK
jgi:hypothetical protein